MDHETDEDQFDLLQASAAAVSTAGQELHVPLKLLDIRQLAAEVTAEVEGEYESALVAGLCREGAEELFRDAALQAARRRLELAAPAESEANGPE